MKRFTDAGRACLTSDNLYSALSLALMLPDICGSLEDPGPNKSKARYERWCKKWIEPLHAKMAKPGEMAEPFLPASECYQLRCGIIHSGSADIPAEKQKDIATFAFFDDSANAHYIYVGGNVINGVTQPTVLQLNARKFSEEMYDAVDRWDASVVGDEAIQAEKKKLLAIHSTGTMISGVRIGSRPGFRRDF